MVRVRRLGLPALLGLAGYYAVFGGEHSVFDLRQARATVSIETVGLDELRTEVAELRLRAEALESDPATLERIARSDFGMIRDGEVLYRFADEPPADEAPPAENR